MQGPQQNQGHSPAQKILQKMHDCRYVEPKYKGNVNFLDVISPWNLQYSMSYLLQIQILIPERIHKANK